MRITPGPRARVGLGGTPARDAATLPALLLVALGKYTAGSRTPSDGHTPFDGSALRTERLRCRCFHYRI